MNRKFQSSSLNTLTKTLADTGSTITKIIAAARDRTPATGAANSATESIVSARP